jgi:hypothetical protein
MSWINVVSEILSFLFSILEVVAHISARRSAAVAEGFRVCLQPVKASDRIDIGHDHFLLHLHQFIIH